MDNPSGGYLILDRADRNNPRVVTKAIHTRPAKAPDELDQPRRAQRRQPVVQRVPLHGAGALPGLGGGPAG